MAADTEVENRPESPALYVLLLGASWDLEQLYMKLACSPDVKHRVYVDNIHYAWGEIRSGRVNTIIIEPQSVRGEADAAAMSVFQIRQEFPEIAFVLVIDNQDFDKVFGRVSPEVRTRLSHYFRLQRNESKDDNAVNAVLRSCQDWHTTVVAKRPSTRTFRYDVAMSFAGEDRQFAEEIGRSSSGTGCACFYRFFRAS